MLCFKLANLCICTLVIAALPLVAIAQELPHGSAVPQRYNPRLEHTFQAVVRPFLKTYCLDCHGGDEPEAKLDLSGYASVNDVGKAHQTWATVLERIEAGEMPPEDAEQPNLQQRSAVVDWMREAREFEAARNAGDPGIVLARRLSNAEYNYTIRDLTGVDIRPTDTFPVDSANEAGFDNSGESLTMSPALLNKYLGAARQVVEHLVLLPDGIAFAPHPVVTDTDRDKYCVNRIVNFYQRQPVDYADYFQAAWRYQHRATLGTATDTIESVAKDHHVSPKYLRMVWELLTDQKDSFGPIKTLRSMWTELPQNKDDQESVRKHCEAMRDFVLQLRPKLSPQVEKIGVEGVHEGSQTFVLWRNRQHAANRRTFDPSVLLVKDSDADQADASSEKTKVDEQLLVPADETERKRHEAAFARFCDVFPDAFFISERGRDYVEESSKQQGEKGRLLSAGFHSMMGYFRDDRPLYELLLSDEEQRELDALWQQLDFIASAPMRQYVGFLWFERTDSRYMRDPQFDFARAEDKNAQSAEMIEKLAEEYLHKARVNGGKGAAIEAIEHYFREINEQIRWVEKARLAAEMSHLQAATVFAERAYRRPLSAAERADLASFYRSLRDDEGLNHEEAIQDVIVSVLMSPHFCYRVDMAASNEARRPLSDYELASRLSYFLWSSMPDAELLNVAENGTLRKREVLIAQTRRMLQDDRVRGLAVEFAGNWLDIRRFEEHNSVDRQRFPEFDDRLRQAMFEEPIRFFVDLIQRDQSLLNLLDADYTFVNAVLAEHYGVEHKPINEYDWVRLDDAKAYGRGGLLPMSVFLTKNAPGLRTSPVKRGYWVVRRLLGERIPPPPPNVPELPDDESKLGELTLREALAKHREHRSCAVCHERIDSFGLVFEGYGPVGERRAIDLGGRPVDTAAILPGGHVAVGVDDLRSYLIVHRQEEFVDNITEKLLSYALGRGLILPDDLLVRDIRDKLQTNDNRFSTLVESIVTSPQFLHKRGKAD
jgi:hypothetical protein